MSEPLRHKVLFDPEALRDLEEIADYVTTTRGPDEADALIRDIMSRAEALEIFPLRGGALKELSGMRNCAFRQLIHQHYRVIYAVLGSTVNVLMVVDGRCDVELLFRDRLRVDPPA